MPCLNKLRKNFLEARVKMWLLAVILWKNLLLRRIHYIVTAFEILLPIGIAALLVWLPSSRFPTFNENFDESRNESAAEGIRTHTFTEFNFCSENSSILYTPVNDATNETIETFIKEACQGGNYKISAEPFESEADLEERFLSSRKPVPKAGLVFPDGLKQLKGHRPNATLPYIIRMKAGDTPSSNTAEGGGAQLYYDGGFLSLQYHVDAALTKIRTNGSRANERKISLRSMPPTHRKAWRIELGLFLLMFPPSLIFMLLMLIRNVVDEKQSGIAELLKLCGVPSWVQVLGWIINSAVLMLLTISACVVVLYTLPPKQRISTGQNEYIYSSPILIFSDGTLIWFILFLYGMSTISMGLFISSLFPKTIYATIATVFVWIVTTIISIVPSYSKTNKLALSLIPTCAINYAFFLVTKLEELVDDSDNPIGAKWKWSVMNLKYGEEYYRDEYPPMYQIMLMMTLDIFLYLFLALYFEGVLPKEFGVRRPWYWFRFGSCKKPWSWFHFCSCKERKPPIQSAPIIATAGGADGNINDTETMTKTDIEAIDEVIYEATSFEPEPVGGVVGIDVQNICKQFNDGQLAVNNVSMKMYSGDIFALLGHNGAGKTTLISTITGFFSPTRGTVKINGYDIAGQLDQARKNMGFCPQHNTLFNVLTVSEQMIIFGMLRGLKYREAKNETNTLITRMSLIPEKTTKAKNLSGGQKRKLSLGLALVGKTSVVILDEATSGIDVQSRREMWDLLLEFRKDRTILLTTHFMEEADVLGDRIGIMVDGVLQCCGSSAFLKKYYGAGYTLKLTFPSTKNEATGSVSETLNNQQGKDAALNEIKAVHHPALARVLTAVQKHVPNATPKANVRDDDEIFLTLPTETATTAALTGMFADLTANKDKLGIQNLGLSQTTIDDVFLRVVENSSRQQPTWIDDDLPKAPKTPRNRVIRDIFALSRKRLIYYKRNWILLLFLVLIWTLSFSVAAIFLQRSFKASFLDDRTRSSARSKLEPRLSLNPELYEAPVTSFSTTRNQSETVATYLEYAIGSLKKQLQQNTEPKGQEIDTLRKHMIAVDVDEKKIVVLYNAIPYHSAPLAMNAAANTILKSLSPTTNYKIQVFNHPISPPSKLPATGRRGEQTINRENHGLNCILCEINISLIALGTLLGVLILSPYFIILPIEENTCQMKQLQQMTGVQPVIYWGSALLVDGTLYFLCICLTLICLTLSEFTWPGVRVLSTNHGMGVLFLILMSYGFSLIPFAYLFSFLFRTKSCGYITLLLSQLLIVQNLGFIRNSFDMVSFDHIFFTLFLGVLTVFEFLFPILPFCHAIQLFFKFGCLYSSGCSDSPYITWSKQVDLRPSGTKNIRQIGQDLFIMLLSGVMYQGLILVIEHRLLNKLLTWITAKRQQKVTPYVNDKDKNVNQDSQVVFLSNTEDAVESTTSPSGNVGEVNQDGQQREVLSEKEQALGISVSSNVNVEHKDANQDGQQVQVEFLPNMGQADEITYDANNDDVRQEAQRVEFLVQTGQVGQECLVVNSITKIFGTFRGVIDLSFGVHSGECFGLLGVNGAGKSTSFKIITGDTNPSKGQVFGFGASLAKNRRQFLSNIGYCPQNDPIIKSFTGLELLELFGVLRGMSLSNAKTEAKKWLRIFGLENRANRQCGKYSGGMKRRLSTAMACIGNPALLVLDESTSGVDPVSRHQFYGVLKHLRDTGHSIVLTSHSMEDCEALCSRLGIMVNGQFQCFGGIQHLKSKFVQGFMVTFELRTNLPYDTDQLQTELLQFHAKIIEQFQPSELKDQHQSKLRYHLQNPSISWDILFKTLEGIKAEFPDLIENYSVNETTLEEVFLSFAKLQMAEINYKRCCGGCCCK